MNDEIVTWDNYKKWITELVKQKKSFYCRGQVVPEWPLQTTFHRAQKQTNISLSEYLDKVIPEIHYHICAIRDELTDLRNEQEFAAFLALIQHHGFPTPLLDWTLSPYIAAYFAYRELNDEHPQSSSVKIFIFDYTEWASTFDQPLNLRETKINYVSILRPYAKYNPRIIPQQGSFTVSNVPDMGSYITSRGNEAQKNFLYTALLSAKEKPVVLKELNLMGINEMTLFPSIGGICRALKTQFFSPESIGLTLNELLEMVAKSNTIKKP